MLCTALTALTFTALALTERIRGPPMRQFDITNTAANPIQLGDIQLIQMVTIPQHAGQGLQLRRTVDRYLRHIRMRDRAETMARILMKSRVGHKAAVLRWLNQNIPTRIALHLENVLRLEKCLQDANNVRQQRRREY
jgi:hypothetical protein